MKPWGILLAASCVRLCRPSRGGFISVERARLGFDFSSRVRTAQHTLALGSDGGRRGASGADAPPLPGGASGSALRDRQSRSSVSPAISGTSDCAA